MSKQVTKSHVRDAVHMYLVNWGATLTESLLETLTIRLKYLYENWNTLHVDSSRSPFEVRCTPPRSYYRPPGSSLN